MDEFPFPFFSAAFFILPIVLLNLAWYVAVIVFLFKIWQKVKHLPG
jgi:hypothetical protein